MCKILESILRFCPLNKPTVTTAQRANQVALIDVAFPTADHATITNRILAARTAANEQLIAESELSWKTLPIRFRSTQEYANEMVSSLRVYGEEPITGDDDYRREKATFSHFAALIATLDTGVYSLYLLAAAKTAGLYHASNQILDFGKFRIKN